MMQYYGGMNAFTNPTPQPTKRPMLALSDDGSPNRTVESGDPASPVAPIATPPRASTMPASAAEQLPPLSPSEQANAMMAAWNAKADQKRDEQMGDDDQDTGADDVMKRPCMKRPMASVAVMISPTQSRSPRRNPSPSRRPNLSRSPRQAASRSTMSPS